MHSNRIRTFEQFKKFDIPSEQQRVIEKLSALVHSVPPAGQTWVALENMPLVGNAGPDTDPLFCFADDFDGLPDEIGIVWDICHASSSAAYLKAVAEGKLVENLVLRRAAPSDLDFDKIAPRVRHWHFAGFKGLNDPARGTECVEGVLPAASDPGEQAYAGILSSIARVSRPDAAINFEVQETDYLHRTNGPQIITWADSILSRPV